MSAKIVSIHVPLAEHDASDRIFLNLLNVSIHVPLAEHDGSLSTTGAGAYCFNSRAPRGARLAIDFINGNDYVVSIHVPLAEHDRLSAQ